MMLQIFITDKYGGVIKFDEQGDGPGRYFILNYRWNRTTRRYGYETVGTWDNGLHMDRQVIWSDRTHTLPVSQCSKPCRYVTQLGMVQYFRQILQS